MRLGVPDASPGRDFRSRGRAFSPSVLSTAAARRRGFLLSSVRAAVAITVIREAVEARA
jgi:hypothetical protein